MAKMVIFKIAIAVAATLATLWQICRRLRMTEGYTVEGQITYLEGKLTGQPLLTFSYTAQGQRFHIELGRYVGRKPDMETAGNGAALRGGGYGASLVFDGGSAGLLHG